MTDYPSKNSSWKKKELSRKWQNLLAIFITLILLLALVNGIFRSFSIEKSLGKSVWMKGAPLLVAVNSTPGSVLVFGPDPGKLVLLTFDEEDYFVSLDGKAPLEKLSNVFASGDALAVRTSAALHLPIRHYLVLEEREVADIENFRRNFADFASLTTPLKTLFDFPGERIKDTNLTRSDMFRLWWVLKSYRSEDLILENFADLSSQTLSADDGKIEVLDLPEVARATSVYLENEKFIKEGFSVKVINNSGVEGVGQLISDMISATGIKVVEVSARGQLSENSLVLAAVPNSFTAQYLAKLLGCDIKSAQNTGSDEIAVVVGRDLARQVLSGI